jgi:hypothetical protein
MPLLRPVAPPPPGAWCLSSYSCTNFVLVRTTVLLRPSEISHFLKFKWGLFSYIEEFVVIKLKGITHTTTITTTMTSQCIHNNGANVFTMYMSGMSPRYFYVG